MQTDGVYADFVEDPGKFMLEILQSIDVLFSSSFPEDSRRRRQT